MARPRKNKPGRPPGKKVTPTYTGKKRGPKPGSKRNMVTSKQVNTQATSFLESMERFITLAAMIRVEAYEKKLIELETLVSTQLVELNTNLVGKIDKLERLVYPMLGRDTNRAYKDMPKTKETAPKQEEDPILS